MATFEVQSTDESHLHIAIAGRLDVAGVEEIENSLVFATGPRRQNVLLDLSGVTFIGSLGVGMLVRIAKALVARGRRLVLYRPGVNVERVLESGGISTILPIRQDLQEALALLQSGE